MLPKVIADTPLDEVIEGMLRGKVEVLPWDAAKEKRADVAAIYTYGHPLTDAAMMDRLPGVKVISNYGVGVDHIDLAAAAKRNIPVGNTPGILDGATADMGFTLLLAAARRLCESDRYARGAGLFAL
jgi:glyoxylate reductase